jgi:serine protease Do
MRKKFDIVDSAKGVVITEVAPEGPGAVRSLQPGDVIAEVDQKAVEAPQDVADRVTAAQENGYRVVTLLINRKGEFQWVALSIAKKE